ncbi:hypothetical protein ACLMJV_17200 [Sinorhizobium meliloti]|uniref:hypothetical protein n=1 Tax=Rhizobium meliloti TaxID=382 RepID=UPI00398CFED6
MTTASYDRVIGRLETKLDMLVTAFEKSSDDSKEYRDRIYSELEHMRTEAAGSRREIADLKKQMDEAGPVISDIKKWRERFVGMQMLLGVIAASLGGGLVILWKWLAAKLGMP